MEESYELQNSILREIFSNTDKRKFHSAMRYAGYYNHEIPSQYPLEIVYPPYLRESVFLVYNEFNIKENIYCHFRKNQGDIVKQKTIFPIKFRQITFNSEVKIGWIESEYKLTFWKCNFNDKLILEDLDYSEINFSECSHIENVIFKNCQIKKLLISDTKIGTICIEGGAFESIEIKNSTIKDFTLTSSFNKVAISSQEKKLVENFSITYSTDIQKSEFILENFQINSLLISGFKSKDNSLTLKDLELNSLEINNFSNQGTLRLHNVHFNKDSNVKIDNSFLGKTELNNVDFSQAKEFYISKSNVLDLITTNTKYPKNRDTYNGENAEDRRELFRQLKTISSKNKEQEQIFEGFELELQRKLTKSCNDWIVLLVNKYTNEYGQNWIRTLVIIMFVIVFSIEFILYELGFPISYSCNNIVDDLPWKFSLYFEFVNPTTKFNDFIKNVISENSIAPSSSKIVFGISRLIILPFLIYQLIAAFRKHGKKA